MPIRPTYPGVYVQEIPSGVRTITGVSTSVAAFIGMTSRGRIGVPTRVLSFTDYERNFGAETSTGEMTDQVRQFFLNGGSQAFVTRIAHFVAPATGQATIDLQNEYSPGVVLTLAAQEAGVLGNQIRAEVSYDTPSPESTFNLRVYREIITPTGAVEIEDDEEFSNLSMEPGAGNYVEQIVNSQSNLVMAVVAGGLGEFTGYAVSGLLIDSTSDYGADIMGPVNTILAGSGGNRTDRIQIRIDDSPFETVTLPNLVDGANPFVEWRTAINNRLAIHGVSLSASLILHGGTNFQFIRFESSTPGGRVEFSPASSNDASVALQLGTVQGGLEVGGHAENRPAPTGYFSVLSNVGSTDFDFLEDFANQTKGDVDQWSLTDSSGAPHSGTTPAILFPGPAGELLSVSAAFTPSGPFVGSLLGVAENLQFLSDRIESDTNNEWRVDLEGLRLRLSPNYGNANSDTAAALNSAGATHDIANSIFNSSVNVRSYSLGPNGTPTAYQVAPGTPGDDGTLPDTNDYRAAFLSIDREVDLFNLMILPRAATQTDAERAGFWGPASAFCREQRAFLLVDPPSDVAGGWTDVNVVDAGIGGLRVGVVNDHSAVYWPRLRIGSGATQTNIDPSGSIAGLMARTDTSRGVWKAPAGTEATLLGVRGVEHAMSDSENGVINPAAVNAIRQFPNGIISWGARTMVGFDNSGNDDYKYVPIRRFALFMEESLYRGLRFAVFEPNDEPLWAQIRLAAGSFMNNLFRQGAFQGQKASDAYFVKVDSETTTQNDINLGIVNVLVGFAPLKPAEFVIISLQQRAGEIQT